MRKATWKWSCGELHVLGNTRPSHHQPPCFNSPEALWKPTSMESSWAFTKQVFWLNHGPVGPVPSLRALSSPQRCRKNKPLITPPRTPLITLFTERFSRPGLWLVSTPRKESKFQEFQESWPWTKNNNQIWIIKSSSTVNKWGNNNG